jgi:hypothetical protein
MTHTDPANSRWKSRLGAWIVWTWARPQPRTIKRKGKVFRRIQELRSAWLVDDSANSAGPSNAMES